MEASSERLTKRRRLNLLSHAVSGTIQSPEHLHQLLQFRQSVAPDVRSAINQFKDFLTAIPKTDSLATQSKHFRVLRQYCDTQTAPSKDDIDFPDLMSTWSFAVQSSNDPICSAIPAALAQFYKTISGVLEFREFGLSLGHTLLKRDQTLLLSRGLSASKTKEHLISPCLRLLTEIVSFDGGALATRVFDRRDILFKRLDFLLDHQESAAEEDRRRPSVRRMALRLLIANLKFLDANAKAEFIAHGRILRTCLRGMMADGDDVVTDVLKSINSGIVEDKDITRSVKGRIFTQENLVSLSALYDYEVDHSHPDSTSRVREAVQELLLKICTTRKGVLLPQTGWYPVAFDTKFGDTSDETYIDLGLDAPSHIDEYNENIPIKNITLAGFAQNLKPESDILQSNLLLQILRSAPELVADYFSKKVKFAPISGEDPVWRSHFAFLFSVIQLPVPRNFGWSEDAPSHPPPSSIVIESIMPRPFGKMILSKHFTSNEPVLALSAAKLLVIALQKLQNVLNMLLQQKDSGRFDQATAKLVETTLQRIPKLQEIVNSLQRTDKDDDRTRLALFECMATYHRVLPEATTGSKFDIGSVLSDLLSRAHTSENVLTPQENLGEQILQVTTIAEQSRATKWFSKPDSDTMSLFGRLLRFANVRGDEEVALQILEVLDSVASSAGFLSREILSYSALQLSIASTKTFSVADETWLLLDNAIHRAVQRPVKYLDQIEAAQQLVSDKRPLSLLAATVAEQWEFAIKKYGSQKDTLKNIAAWVTRLYGALESAGENFRVMQQFQDDMLQLGEVKPGAILQKAVDKGRKKPVALERMAAETVIEPEVYQSTAKTKSVDLNEILGAPVQIDHSLEGLDRWDDNTDIEYAIQSGKVARLIRCAVSDEEEVRRQAFQFLQTFTHAVERSAYDEKAQVYLLFGELVQSIRQHGLEAPVPTFVVELAIRLLRVLTDPTDKLYGKANKFLLRSPIWDMKRLASYWIREILFQEPESDAANAWTDEVDWLVKWFVDGLQTSVDMEAYRTSGVFEKVLALYTKPNLSRPTKKLVLTLVWRAICVGGADTLTTRVGIQDWLRIISSNDRDFRSIVEKLGECVSERCDAKSIDKWEKDLPVLRSGI